jgi:muconate cycloisomerase
VKITGLITGIEVTPLRLTLKTPYIWSQGTEDAFTVNLIRLRGADGAVGLGECTVAPDADAQRIVLLKLARHLVGRSVFDLASARDASWKADFAVWGAAMPRAFNQLWAGLEMAALDLQGKVLGRPVWDLLGGARRASVGYFDFLQGETPEALARDAARAVAAGSPILYLKVGVERTRDLASVAAVRAAAPGARLRLDANEAWDPATAKRMIALLHPYDIEYIEQPTPAASLPALAEVTAASPIAIGADQAVFTLEEVYRACATGAGDMIAAGPRELGGLHNTVRAADIVAAAGKRFCIHSSMTTGITTAAEHHCGRTIGALDDGNQIMWQLLARDIVAAPDLAPKDGLLALPDAPGLGVTLDEDAVAEAAAAHRAFAAGHAAP